MNRHPSTLERFLTWASENGFALLVDQEHGSLWVRGREGKSPILVSINPRDFDANFPSYFAFAVDTWPDVTPEVAGFRLLTVHIQEAVDVADPSVTSLHFDGNGFAPPPTCA